MADTWWSAYVEFESDFDTSSDAFEKLVSKLGADFDGVVSVTSTGWGAQISIEGDPMSAVRIVSEIAYTLGILAHEVVRYEAIREDLLDADIATPNFPDILGTQEVTQMLGISRQRLHHIRSHNGRFPQPMVELAAGPIWLRPAIESFESEWDRRPGRPAVPAGSVE